MSRYRLDHDGRCDCGTARLQYGPGVEHLPGCPNATPQPSEQPVTSAGRALLDALPLNEWHPINREIVIDHVLAIEAEAAAAEGNHAIAVYRQSRHAAPDPVASPRVTAEHLEAAIGKALYGWGDDEPNEATGWTTRTEVKRVVLAVIETLSGDPRLDPVASPAPLDPSKVLLKAVLKEAVAHVAALLPFVPSWKPEHFGASDWMRELPARLEGQPVAGEPRAE